MTNSTNVLTGATAVEFSSDQIAGYVLFLERASMSSSEAEMAGTLRGVARTLHQLHARVLDLELELAQLRSRNNTIPPPSDLLAVDRMLDELDPEPEIVLEDDDYELDPLKVYLEEESNVPEEPTVSVKPA